MTDSPARLRVSVVIVARDDAMNIEACIASCSASDDIHVVDAGSSDGTAGAAARLGARVHAHGGGSAAELRNHAIDAVETAHPWVLCLDADERLTPALAAEIGRTLATEPAEAGFFVPGTVMFMGKPLRRAAAYPAPRMRLFHRGRMRFRDYGGSFRESTDGRTGILREPCIEHPFAKGVGAWLDRSNRRSTLDAMQLESAGADRWSVGSLFAADAVVRSRARTALVHAMPFGAALSRFARLFAGGAILEGHAAREYTRLEAMRVRMTSIKRRLMRENGGLAAVEAPAPPHPEDATRIAVDRGRSGDLPTGIDGLPRTRAEPSPYSFREKLGRLVWMVVGRPIFRASFHNWYGFRRRLLRLFGAKLGEGVAIRPSAHIEIPWMLEIDDGAVVGDEAILYCLGRIRIGKRAIVSQYAHLCAGTHDFTSPTFPLIRATITIGDDVWIGTDAFVGPGVTIGQLSVLGARSSAYTDLPPQQICVGNPAKPLRRRELRA